MNKQRYLGMGYNQLNTTNDEMDTLYKKFDNGNMWVVQFNEEVQEDAVGVVYLTKEQVKKIFDK